jgi:hypothetical protein
MNINTRKYKSLQGGLSTVQPVQLVKPVLFKSQKTSNFLGSIKNFEIPILNTLSKSPKSIRTIIRNISRDNWFDITKAKPMLDKMLEYLDNNMIDITLTFQDNKKISRSLLLPLPTEYKTTIYHSRINMNLPISIFDEKKELILKKTPIQRHSL